MTKRRAIILIDGSNFYFKLKDLQLHDQIKFDFLGFAKYLAKDHQITQANYYIGAIRTDKTKHTQQLFTKQQKLFAYLNKNNFHYSLGYLLKSDGKLHEKGVDVNMAVDILVATYEDLCDSIILVSSDTDLIPVIKKAKEKGKNVMYVGFSHKPSVALVANCSVSKLLSKDDLEQFIKI